MHQLAIISQHSDYYLTHLTLPENVNLCYHSTHSQWTPEMAHADIILAEPDLIQPHIQQCQNLKWLQSTWAGGNVLMNNPCTHYQLTGLKDIFGFPMAEYVMAYLLYFSRNIAGFSQAQQQHLWQPVPFTSLRNKHMGILGTGSIGQEVAKRARQFGMRVSGLSRSQAARPYFDHIFDQQDLLEHASQFDYLISVLPDTPQTHHLIDTPLLKALPRHCIVINGGRSNVINDESLLQALDTQQIAAAVLDVFDQEPLPASHAFWSQPNLYVTQHTAARSFPEDILPIFCDNLERFIRQQPLKYLMDFEKGY